MYSGKYDACGVTLSVYPHRASLKNMPGHGGNRTYDLCNTSPMLGQLSYAVRSVRVCDISESSLVPSISICSLIIMMIFCTKIHTNLMLNYGVGIFRVKPFEFSPFRVDPLPRPFSPEAKLEVN